MEPYVCQANLEMMSSSLLLLAADERHHALKEWIWQWEIIDIIWEQVFLAKGARNIKALSC
jgi:hypothetical protein